MILHLFAVFTEQGPSASQMTAARVMDIISRLPGCDGQAADAVSAYTQVKMEDAHKLFKKSKIGMSRHVDSSTTTQMAQIMVQYGRPSCSSRKESVRSSAGRTTLGEAVRESSSWKRMGKKFQIGNGFSLTEKKGLFFICVCGRDKTGSKDRKGQSDVENDHERR